MDDNDYAPTGANTSSLITRVPFSFQSFFSHNRIEAGEERGSGADEHG